MSIIKKEIQQRGQTAYIKIPIGSNQGFLGYQQNIDNLTNFESLDVVNNPIDAETRRYSYSNNSSTTLEFSFLKNDAWDVDFECAGFSSSDIQTQTDAIQNSYFIWDFFDTYIASKQRRIFSTYLTKVLYYTTVPRYTIYTNTNNLNITQFQQIFIPRSYIQEQTSPIVTGYSRFMFFSGLGTDNENVKIFNYPNTSSSIPEEKLYVRTILNFTGRTWQFEDSGTIRLEQIRGAQYNTRMSNTVDKEKSYTPNYPLNPVFDYSTQTYICNTT